MANQVKPRSLTTTTHPELEPCDDTKKDIFREAARLAEIERNRIVFVQGPDDEVYEIQAGQ